MKYIIEIEEEPFTPEQSIPYQGNELYRAKGFNSLVFDKNGLEKLETYISEEAENRRHYRRGYAEGLKQARKVIERQYARFLMTSSAAEVMEEEKSHE